MRLSFLLLVTVTVLLPCQAAKEGPHLRNGTLGRNAPFHNRFWTPLTVDLENPGPAGTFCVVAETRGEKSGQLVQFTCDVWLPSNAWRQVEFPVLPDLRAATDGSRVQTPFQLRLTDGHAHVYDTIAVLGNAIPEEAFTILAADSRFVSYLCLKDAVIGPEKRPVGRVVTDPDHLPRRPLDYRGFDAMMLGDLGETRLSPLQQRALRVWVRAGGHLIVVPGAVTADAQLGDLLPGQCFSSRVVETLPGIAPDTRFPNGIRFYRLLVDSRRRPEIICGNANRPLVVTRTEGLGRVTALAFDAGSEDFQHWTGAREFLAGLLAEPTLLPYADRLLERSTAVEGLLSSLAGIKVVARTGLLMYLVVVVGGLLGVIVMFRFTRAPELGWALAALLAIGGSVAAVAVAVRWKAQPSPFLTQLFVLTARSGTTNANLQAALGLFSPSQRSYRVTAPDDTISLRPGPSALTPPEQLVVGYESRLVLPQVRVRAEDIRLLYGRGPITTARLPRARLAFSAGGARITVENPGDIPLADGFVKYNRFVLPVGDVTAGGRVVLEGLREPTGLFSARLVHDDRDELRSRMRRVFFPEPVFSLQSRFGFEERWFYNLLRGREPRPLFCAWSDRSPALLAQVDPPVAQRASGLWAIEAETTFEGDHLLVPRGVLDLRLRSRGTATSNVGEGKFFGTRSTRLWLEFRLPDGWPALALEEATVFLEFRSSAFAPALRIAPREWRGEDDDAALRGFTRLPPGPRCRIPKPQRFYNPATGSLVLVLDIEPAQTPAPGSEGLLLGLNHWQVREVEVELTGARNATP